jgi:hypothetical protein
MSTRKGKEKQGFHTNAMLQQPQRLNLPDRHHCVQCKPSAVVQAVPAAGCTRDLCCFKDAFPVASLLHTSVCCCQTTASATSPAAVAGCQADKRILHLISDPWSQLRLSTRNEGRGAVDTVRCRYDWLCMQADLEGLFNCCNRCVCV